jgi:hypothetical protein
VSQRTCVTPNFRRFFPFRKKKKKTYSYPDLEKSKVSESDANAGYCGGGVSEVVESSSGKVLGV